MIFIAFHCDFPPRLTAFIIFHLAFSLLLADQTKVFSWSVTSARFSTNNNTHVIKLNISDKEQKKNVGKPISWLLQIFFFLLRSWALFVTFILRIFIEKSFLIFRTRFLMMFAPLSKYLRKFMFLYGGSALNVFSCELHQSDRYSFLFSFVANNDSKMSTKRTCLFISITFPNEHGFYVLANNLKFPYLAFKAHEWFFQIHFSKHTLSDWLLVLTKETNSLRIFYLWHRVVITQGISHAESTQFVCKLTESNKNVRFWEGKITTCKLSCNSVR